VNTRICSAPDGPFLLL